MLIATPGMLTTVGKSPRNAPCSAAWFAVLVGAPVVDALALEAVLERVLELVGLISRKGASSPQLLCAMRVRSWSKESWRKIAVLPDVARAGHAAS